MDESEKPIFELLLQTLQRIDPWLRRIDGDTSTGFPDIDIGSTLHSDDERLDPYQMSHAAWGSLSHAVDHLNMLRSALRDQGVIHMFAPYSILRAALENASSAVWLLGPDSRTDRLTRRLRMAYSDVYHGSAVADLLGAYQPRSRQDRYNQLKALAAKEKIGQRAITKSPSYEEIVKYAGGKIRAGERLTQALWKAGSGIAHGDMWATLSIMQLVEIPGPVPEIANMRVAANMKTLFAMTFAAVDMTGTAWRIMDSRSRTRVESADSE